MKKITIKEKEEEFSISTGSVNGEGHTMTILVIQLLKWKVLTGLITILKLSKIKYPKHKLANILMTLDLVYTFLNLH